MGNQRSKLDAPGGAPSSGEGKGPATVNSVTDGRAHAPGEGIRSMKTSSAFRALNFELYAKPSKPVMYIGAASFTLALCYLTYMRYSYDNTQYYESLAENGDIVLRPRKSRWES